MKRWCLVIVDSSSKWVECVDMGTNTTSNAVISVLRELFARFGLPNYVISDNCTSFVSDRFKTFLKINGIEHITTPVGHPATNGQAENTVKTIKNALKRNLCNTPLNEFNTALCRFLFDYRNTVHSSTGVSPTYLMFNKRKLKTRLDLINPKRKVEGKSIKEIKEIVEKKQENQIKYHKGIKENYFHKNTTVLVKDFSVPGKVSWKKGIIFKVLGKQIYLVKVETNKIWKRHANQIISCSLSLKPDTPTTVTDPLQKIYPTTSEEKNYVYNRTNENQDHITGNNQENNNVNPDNNDTNTVQTANNNDEISRKYNLRERKQKI